MLGASGSAGNSTTHPAAATSSFITAAAAAAAAEAHDQEGGSDRCRKETMALLRIRSEMDAAFRDSSYFKAPLWEEVSRKMVEQGFNKNGKKCREKFENMCKYHKRTKEGRSSKSRGKKYKYFDQIAALENATPPLSETSVELVPPPHPTMEADPIASPPSNAMVAQLTHHDKRPTIVSVSSSDDEDDERRGKRQRKEMAYYMEELKGVIEKQDELHKQLLETFEKKEKERTSREEAWNQEMEKIRREYDLLAQERLTLVSFLEKTTHPQTPKNSTSETDSDPIQRPPSDVAPELPLAVPPPQDMVPPQDDDNGDEESSMSTKTSIRWAKAEIEQLIKIRTDLKHKYQKNGLFKGTMWQETSLEMSKVGYNRSSTRCKEKWENINKYFRRVKEKKKKGFEGSKTCPYYHQLDALYKEKHKGSGSGSTRLLSANAGPITR